MAIGRASDEENRPSEKEGVMHLEHQPDHGLSPDEEAFLANFSEEAKAKVLRKVDWRLIPMLLLLYLVAYIDKTNIGNAKIEGLLASLGMNGEQYNIALSVFFIPFVLAEVPSNIILNRFKKPSIYLGSLIFIWGVVMTCTGFVQSFGALIFIIEGLATIMLAIMCFFLLLDSPHLSSKWLTPDEIRFLELRQLANNIQSTHQKGVAWDALIGVLTDWKIYLLILASWSNSVPNYALKFTMPQIIKSMGFTSAKAQLLTIPPYAVGAISAYVFSIFADRYTWRMPFIVAPQLSQVVAFSILFSKAAKIEENIALCYFGVCLACFGMYPILPGVNAWNVSNLPNPTKRAIGIGYLVCMGNVGGIIGSFIYQEREAPRYPTGYGNSFAFASAGIIACIVLELFLSKLNKKKAQFGEEEIRQRYTDEELREMGEKSPLFQYKL
ncbi:hypothetical protein BBP40_008464 [Aspergillus hancockii]|nr:hypothetical protein BBP40_008464 [Aspergillus hancockii]